jgi:hypothetical protein
MKSVPNWIFYLHKFFCIFIPFLSIFLALETGFGVSFKFFSANVWGLDVSGYVGRRWHPIGHLGRCLSQRPHGV